MFYFQIQIVIFIHKKKNPYEKSFKLEFENFENDITFICMPVSGNAYNINSDFSDLQELTCKFSESDVTLVCNKMLNGVKLTTKEKNLVEFFTNPSLWNCDTNSSTMENFKKWQEIIEKNMKK